MKYKKIMLLILSILFFTVSFLISFNQEEGKTLICNIMGSILLLIYVVSIYDNFINLVVVFSIFHIVYGLSGPINVVWGEGMAAIFGNNYNVGAYLFAYAIASIAYLLGLSIYSLVKKNKSVLKNDDYNIENIIKNKNNCYKYAFILAILTTVSELINCFRVGGLESILKGKAYYQAAVADLSISMPTSWFIGLSSCFIGIYIGICYYKNEKINIKRIIMYIVVLIPYIGIYLFLGMRGEFLVTVLCILVGVAIYRPIKKIKIKWIFVLIITYVIICIVYANRGRIDVLFKNPKDFLETAFKKERIVTALNPGNNEFGATFGNFNKFYTVNNSDYDMLLGKSYIDGLATLIPSFLYMGEKPQQIGYYFRDKYFPTESNRSSIASTGFSSLLESYWNFGYCGIAFIYFVVGFLISLCENKLKYKNVSSLCSYMILITLCVYFHRFSLNYSINIIVYENILKLIVIYTDYIINNTRYFNSYTQKNVDVYRGGIE